MSESSESNPPCQTTMREFRAGQRTQNAAYRKRILELLKQGFNYTEIGAQLGLTRQRVQQLLPRKEWKEMSAKKEKKKITFSAQISP